MDSQARSLAGTTIGIVGASSGIGAATAKRLGMAGANLVLTARRADRLKILATELESENVEIAPGDVRDPDASRLMVEHATTRFGRLDSLVVAAGIGAYGGIMELDDDLVREMIETNYTGTVWAVRAAVPAMLDRGGDIVIVSSVAGLRGGPREAVYAGTKFAQVGMAGSIDRELRERGIRVTAICPAAVNTEFALGAGRTEGDPWLGDVLQPDDVAAAIVTVLEQPRRVRTTMWSMWSMAQGG